jgi:two-component system, NarL family, response regulator LiaR
VAPSQTARWFLCVGGEPDESFACPPVNRKEWNCIFGMFMGTLRDFMYRSRSIFLYGGLMALLVLVLKWLQWKFLITDYSLEVYVGLIAVLFTGLGVWIATQLTRSRVRTVVVEVPVEKAVAGAASMAERASSALEDAVGGEDGINVAELERLGLSDREYEVLALIARGYSNAEIAAELFLSVSTVKTHVSNVFVKMDVRSRTQALEKAKRLRITP